ncbi:hypothetical protein [Flavobacterium chungangense]|uniref:DUF4595 domain-containing protein n=1 Tax=Flavobacterium chungangense TaxID=554283 RepID=A0A6V6Z7N4_9FLAO|nr:hypothetical protein [Flavobacterium chungangense]CAD0007454.1 hypothetical protein FLACHUCJ7_03306 [Flavobacterium chungangense]
MNYTKHLLVPIICLLLLSCSKDDNDNTDNNSPSVKTSLPVKVMYKNATGNVIETRNITYDTKKRISKIVIVNQNASLNSTQTFIYENGKITQLYDWDDTVKPLEKFVFFYDANGMKNEELYHNGNIVFATDWFYRPDGGKERRVKNASGVLVTTWYYKFSATGNIVRVVVDKADASQEDFEYTFSNYDNKLRTMFNTVNNTISFVLLGFSGTNLPVPNNPFNTTYKSLTTGNVISASTNEYTYNTKNQVTIMKLKNSDTGALIETRTIEYQEF